MDIVLLIAWIFFFCNSFLLYGMENWEEDHRDWIVGELPGRANGWPGTVLIPPEQGQQM